MIVQEIIENIDKNSDIQVIDNYNRATFVGQAYLDDIKTNNRIAQIKYFRNIDSNMENKYHEEILKSKVLDVSERKSINGKTIVSIIVKVQI